MSAFELYIRRGWWMLLSRTRHGVPLYGLLLHSHLVLASATNIIQLLLVRVRPWFGIFFVHLVFSSVMAAAVLYLMEGYYILLSWLIFDARKILIK
ncbi:hypothetical protein JDV02_007143 [Purpureocillium takamizusanense]|uniref:Uncharacterized protein n=1 Tax=Purpureocillium takamizusanense TaxID=2060973 RepID=A0A9Q8VDF6_9HYPO|nr:uncharacterized protein JDV02_007143 [Purpureocillium takamizusanense]UNI21126.1 hypothetical protein JDV02_007143 [Purpureocillium takamizusanense]